MEQTILFWSRSGDWRWLSNMEIDPFTDENGATWPSVEHFYQAEKTRIEQEREQIRTAPSPFDAKRMGGRLASCRRDWKTYRVTAMQRALALRFRAGSPAARRLLATGKASLVHHTPWGRTGDPFWGDGRDGGGQNMLGRLLMERRETLAAETAATATETGRAPTATAG